ncbi:MAG: exonuclease SbcCD subunit D [Oscillospiraceae bacterium]|nr:exonuclease SbcCD subunit D [Oscillospiraceae bacterium]
MKMLHISDLHLGKRLNNFSFLEDQEYILNEILRIVDEERPDAVLIAGDVYDKSVPSVEAVQLLDRFLNLLAARGITVLLISGNHDSAERLSFGNQLMERAGIYISHVYDGTVKTVTLQDEHGEVHFHLLPFLKPIHVRRFFPDEVLESYTDAMRAVIAGIDLDPAKRNVLLTHQFVTGAATCESEEHSVGGTDNVDASVFDRFDYVALGHIHGPQNIGSNRIRYCGTPLKYSFSEETHHKSVTVVRLGEKGDLRLDVLPLLPKRELRTVKGTFQELLNSKNYSDDYIHAVLTDEEDVHEAMGRLRVVYPRLMHLSYDNTRTRSSHELEDLTDVEKKSPLEVFCELYEQQNNQPMSEEQLAYCKGLIEEMEGK